MLQGLVPITSIGTLTKKSGRSILLPFYHTVSNKNLPHIEHLYQHRSLQKFEQDLDTLCRYYNPISIDELYSIVHCKKANSKPVFHLTFDDGLREVYTMVAPILEKKGIPATIFLNSGFVDNKELFFRYKVSLLINQIKGYENISELSNTIGSSVSTYEEAKMNLLKIEFDSRDKLDQLAKLLGFSFSGFLSEYQPYLTTTQIKDLMQRGFTFGSHSVNHPLFKELKTATQHEQVSQSFDHLESSFGFDQRYFSFPFSDDGLSSSFIQSLQVDHNVKLSFGVSGLKDDVTPYHLHRTPMEGNDRSAEEIIKMEYLYYGIKAFFNKNRIVRT